LTFDTIMGISGVAVGVAALIPIYIVKGVRGWIATAVVIVFLVLMSIAILYQRHAEGREIDRLENEIRRMFSGNNPHTFEEIYDGLNYAPYDLVVKAIDELIDSDKIWVGRIDVKSPSGTMYVVRVFNNINFPVPLRRFAPESTEPVDAPKVCPATLPQYVSPRVDGGHTQAEMCQSTLATYTKQYPGCDITWSATESNNKDFFGHVTYQYYCSFTAKPKA
jgi:hypothetical protein